MEQRPARRISPIAPALLAAAGVLVVVGATGVWAETLFDTVNGTDTEWGTRVIIMGVAGAALALAGLAFGSHWPLFLAVIPLVAAGVVGVVGWARVEDVVSDVEGLDPTGFISAEFQVGWGVKLLAISGLASPVALLFTARRPRRP